MNARIQQSKTFIIFVILRFPYVLCFLPVDG